MLLDPPIELIELNIPEFGEPIVQPIVPKATYDARILEALGRAKNLRLDAVVIYGDREHNGSMTYLTGYDPRFEEALLVLKTNHEPTLIVGNEGWGYSELVPIAHRRVLFQSFSLMGQPRGDSKSLPTILKEAGLSFNDRVGLAGWKHFDAQDGMTETDFEVPSYIVDCMRGLVAEIVNAGPIFSNPRDGMRVINDVDQLAVFEHASTFTSQGLRNVLFNLRPAMTEFEGVRLMGQTGLPHGAHTMLSSGARARYGLPSPSAKLIEEGDPITMAYCVWGALTARAGFFVKDENGLPAEIRDYVSRLAAPYFSAAVAWYEALEIGAPAKDLYHAVHRRIGEPFFGLALNPGHYIHLEEWLNSPVTATSQIPLRSGMALQIDIIPATGTKYFTSNIEDGIALADLELREKFKTLYPEAWTRIEKRREFMINDLGIRLRPEVLPFSNIPAYLPPYFMSPRHAFAVRRR